MSEHSFPAVHALHLLDLVHRFGVSTEALLAGTGLLAAGLAEPTARLSIPEVEELVERARRLTGEPGLGFHLGLQMRIVAHGNLGFAAMTAGTLGEATEVAARFIPTRTTALALCLRVDRGAAQLVIEERAVLGPARDVMLLWLLVGLVQIGKALTGQELLGSLDLAFRKPSYFDRFAHLAAGRVRFGQAENRLCFDAALLDLPLLFADPVAGQIARAQCEKELEALRLAGSNEGAAVLGLLTRADGGFPSLEAAAARLHLSPRTLKRRLAARGTSYSALLDEARQRRAEVLLHAGLLSMEEIGERLGYSDAANFTRAFRRWTGTTPRRFRRAAIT